MNRSGPGTLRVLIVSAACVGFAATANADPPDSRVNPVSGAIETADATLHGGNTDIRHAVNPGPGQPIEVFFVTTDVADDRSPRIAIGTSGDTWIAWWRNGATPSVLVRKRRFSDGAWLSERTVGNTATACRNPEIAFDGSQVWVAFEETTASGLAIRCGTILDEPTPIDTAVVGTTSYAGDVDTLVHAESGKLWVSWVDSASQVAWSKYDPGTQAWTTPALESYASDSVAAARGRIRATVLGD